MSAPRIKSDITSTKVLYTCLWVVFKMIISLEEKLDLFRRRKTLWYLMTLETNGLLSNTHSHFHQDNHNVDILRKDLECSSVLPCRLGPFEGYLGKQPKYNLMCSDYFFKLPNTQKSLGNGVLLPEFTSSYCLTENPSWLFFVPKMTFLSLRKQHSGS